MASAASFPYQRLMHEGGLLGADDDYREGVNIVKSRGWLRFRRVQIRRRFRLKVPSLKRWVLRKKLRVMSVVVRLSCTKVMKRLKESQAKFGDLFAGNYLFLQINPATLKSFDNKCSSQAGNGV